MKAKSFWKFNIISLLKILITLAALFLLVLALLILLRVVATNRASNNHPSPKFIDSLINSILNSRFVHSYFGPWITRRNTSLNRSVSPQKVSLVSPKKTEMKKKVSFEANDQIIYSIHDPPSLPKRTQIPKE